VVQPPGAGRDRRVLHSCLQKRYPDTPWFGLWLLGLRESPFMLFGHSLQDYPLHRDRYEHGQMDSSDSPSLREERSARCH
jgi:hypothetical protein